mgnify:CR=1 FL=1
MQNITNDLPQQPEAKIIVDGLFILCVNEEKRVAEIGVYEYANEHELFVRVSKKEHGIESELFKGGKLIRKLDDDKHTGEIKIGDVAISMSGKPADIVAYHHPAITEESLLSDPREISSEIALNDEEYSPDFRWIINLEGARFHGKKLEVVPGVIRRKIHISNGILYTEEWARREIKMAYETAARLAGKKADSCYYYIARRLGIAIEQIDENQTLNITYGDPQSTQMMSLSKPDEGIYYEILISNNCRVKDVEKKNRQSDFQNYYNVVNVPIAERIDLDILLGSGSKFAPCDLIYLGETSELP